MESGRRIAAQAVEARRGELGLKQSDFGIDPTTYRDFIKGEHWPTPRTRARIEARLGWKVGRITEIAHDAARNNGSVAALAQSTDDPDEVALLTSELSDQVKRRLIARLWAAKRRRPRSQGETGTSQAT
jgi:hypothetical protein